MQQKTGSNVTLVWSTRAKPSELREDPHGPSHFGRRSELLIDIVRHGGRNIHAKSEIQYTYCTLALLPSAACHRLSARATIAERPTVDYCDMSAAPDSTTPASPKEICHSPRARDGLEPRPFQQTETI